MDTQECIRRLRLITPLLEVDIHHAISSHSIMEASNDVIPKEMDGALIQTARIYNAIQNALGLQVALDLARLFDYNPHRALHSQDKASIPIFAGLIALDKVKSELLECMKKRIPEEVTIGLFYIDQAALNTAIRDAREKEVNNNINDFSVSFNRLMLNWEKLNSSDSAQYSAVSRLKEFRNRRLAHALFDKSPDRLPSFNDLKLLIDFAIEFVADAIFIVEGKKSDLISFSKMIRQDSEQYAKCVLEGLRNETKYNDQD